MARSSTEVTGISLFPFLYYKINHNTEGPEKHTRGWEPKPFTPVPVCDPPPIPPKSYKTAQPTSQADKVVDKDGVCTLFFAIYFHC